MIKQKPTLQVDPQFQKTLDNLKDLPTKMRDEAWKELFRMAVELEQDVKRQMPVDTGRAKAGWGRWSPEHLTGVSKAKAATLKKAPKRKQRIQVASPHDERAQVSSARDGIWIEDEKTLTITQGTNVPYTIYLNEGHSDFAPEGFIDDAITAAKLGMSATSDRLTARAEALVTGTGTTHKVFEGVFRIEGGKRIKVRV